GLVRVHPQLLAVTDRDLVQDTGPQVLAPVADGDRDRHVAVLLGEPFGVTHVQDRRTVRAEIHHPHTRGARTRAGGPGAEHVQQFAVLLAHVGVVPGPPVITDRALEIGRAHA